MTSMMASGLYNKLGLADFKKAIHAIISNPVMTVRLLIIDLSYVFAVWAIVSIYVILLPSNPEVLLEVFQGRSLIAFAVLAVISYFVLLFLAYCSNKYLVYSTMHTFLSNALRDTPSRDVYSHSTTHSDNRMKSFITLFSKSFAKSFFRFVLINFAVLTVLLLISLTLLYALAAIPDSTVRESAVRTGFVIIVIVLFPLVNLMQVTIINSQANQANQKKTSQKKPFSDIAVIVESLVDGLRTFRKNLLKLAVVYGLLAMSIALLFILGYGLWLATRNSSISPESATMKVYIAASFVLLYLWLFISRVCFCFIGSKIQKQEHI